MVRLGGFHQMLGEVRVDVVIAVHELDILAPGQLQAQVAGVGHAGVLLVHQHDAAVLGAELLTHGQAVILGAIVQDDEFNVFIGLVQDAADAAGQMILSVVYGQDDADERLIHGGVPHFFFVHNTPSWRKNQALCRGKGGADMIFHIAVCSPDPVLRGRVQRHCMEYYARRADACIVEQLESTAALLQQEEAGSRYELYLIELPAANPCCGLQAAAELRRRGVRAPLAFLAHTTAYAYEAFRVDAMQYLHIPFRPEQLTALLDRATEPEYGPVIPVATAMGLRALPFADIEYLECTHHVVHYHLASGEDVASLSLRVPFSEVAKPLLADARFLQPHRSYVVNLAAAAQLSSGELWMRSGARVPIPRGREPAVRAAFRAFLEG